METWYHEVNQYVKPTTKKILVGNKCDMEFDRQVPKEEAARKAEELGMKFMEVSAKDSTGVEDAFTVLAAQIVNDLPQNPNAEEQRRGILSFDDLPTMRGNCCGQ